MDPVHTHVMGSACSMEAIISSSGEPGHRTISPNSRITIHQLLVSNASGQASDIAILVANLEYAKTVTNTILAKNAGYMVEEIEVITDRDHWYSTTEAIEFSLADSILDSF